MNWSPEVWNDIGVVAILILIAASHALALVRGWIVLGPHHREVISAKNKTIENADARSAKDQETIAVQAQTIAKTDATDQANAHLLSAIREMAERRGAS